MFRSSDMILIAVMVSAAAFTYQTKHDAEEQLGKVRRLEAQIRFEEESIDLLKADWSLLTQPSRLQRLAEVYKTQLDLEQVQARQIVGLNELPEKPIVIPDPSRQTESTAGLSIDEIITGGIDQ